MSSVRVFSSIQVTMIIYLLSPLMANHNIELSSENKKINNLSEKSLSPFLLPA